MIMSDAERIGAEDIARMLELESAIKPGVVNDSASVEAFPRPYRKVHSDERERIIAALRQAQGNKTHAARQLGMSPRQLHYRLIKLKIEA